MNEYEKQKALEEVVRKLKESAEETIRKSGYVFWRRVNDKLE